MSTKKTLLIIMSMIMLAWTINQATAADWTQYTPSPTVNSIDRIVALSNGKAFATAGSGTNFLLYNGTAWNEISQPSGGILGSYTNYRNSFDKTLDGKIHLLYFNSTYAAVIIGYNPMNNSYYLEQNVGQSFSNFGNIECDETTNNCYLNTYVTPTYSLYQVLPTINLLANNSGTPEYNTIAQSDKGIYLVSSAGTLSEWNGISFITRYTASTSQKHIYESISKRAACSGNNNAIRIFNLTSNSYHISGLPNCILDAIATTSSNTFYYTPFSSNTINKCDWNTITCNNDTNTIQQITSIDYDSNSNQGWAGGNNGVIYQLISTGSSAYDVVPRIATSPTQYGSQVIFYGKATSSTNLASNLTLELWDANFSTLLYTTTINNVASGLETELYRLNTNSPSWGTYPLGNYIYNIQSTDGITTIANSTTWTVTNGATTNITTYAAICYPSQISGINGIYSVTNWDEDHTYSSATLISTNKPTILSFDTTQKQNIITNQLSVYDIGSNTTIPITLNQIIGRNGNPSTISRITLRAGSDKLYVGTNDDLFVFTNASNKTATGLKYEQDNGFGILQNDGINDVTSTSNNNIAYVCQDGAGLIDDDDVFKYYDSNGTFTDQMNVNPCRSLIWDSNFIYVHRGYNNDVQIWNSANQSLLSTIDITKTISTLTYNDILSLSNQYLSIIAGQDEIRTYDITNKTNPTLSKKCFMTEPTEQITSIEMLNDNEIIIGTQTNLYVCDYTNNQTYNTSIGGYVAQVIAPIDYSQSWEISKNNNQGKFSVAENEGYDACYYTKNVAPINTNNPPVISQVTKTTSTPCMNQYVAFQIIASDPDPLDVILGYNYDCNGGIPTTDYTPSKYQFTCSYTTTGTKTISIGVRDSSGATTSTSTSIVVQNCTQINPSTLFMRIIDSVTGLPIEGATLNLLNITSRTIISTQTTDSLGYADFNGLDYIQYGLTYSKSGYVPETQSFYPSNDRITRWLNPINGTTNQALLTIMVFDKNNTPIENALVGATDIITGESRSTLTDYTGAGYILGITPSDKLMISAAKTGYSTTSTYSTIGVGEQKTLTIIMGIQGSGFTVTSRGCSDPIKGVLLCGNLSVTGIGSSCLVDADCISGKCDPTLSGLTRTCANFNWTICDAQGLARGNTCYMRAIGNGTGKGFGNWILNNFLYVLLFIAIFIMTLMFIRAIKR